MTQSAHRRLPTGVSLAGAVLVGVLTATQSRVNGSLGVGMGDGIAAAVVSFGSGLAIIGAISLLLPSGRAGLAALITGVRERRIPVWMLCGGFAGAFTVASQGIAVGVIGVALFTVGFVAGQTVHGVVLDRVGYGPAGVVPVTLPRVLGAAVVLGGVVTGVVALGGSGADASSWWLLALPFLAGAGVAWQQGTNGRLRQQVGTPVTATLVNFIGGTLALAIVHLVHIIVADERIVVPTDPWLYLGGAIGVVYILLSAALVRHTGVLLLGLGSVVGLLSTSLVLDLLWPPQAGASLWGPALAVAIALAGAVIAVVPWRRRR